MGVHGVVLDWLLPSNSGCKQNKKNGLVQEVHG